MKRSKFNLSLALRVVFLAIVTTGLVLYYPTVTNLFVASGGKTTKHRYTGEVGARNYHVYTPKGYSVTSKVPLVVVIHGCTETPLSIAANSKFNDLADNKKFIVVYPEQSLLHNGLMCWNFAKPADQIRGMGEPAIIAGIVQEVQKSIKWNIDQDRTYVVGLSTGAAMTVILGVTYPDVFAAIGVASGFQYRSATTLAQAVQQVLLPGPDPIAQGHVVHRAMGSYARRVPTIVFHGTADMVVPFVHGQEVVISMAVANSLADPSFNNTDIHKPSSTERGQASVLLGRKYTAMSWNDVNGKAVVKFYQVEGMNHAWSGGATPLIFGADIYTDPLGPSFTEITYDFLLDNSLNAAAAVVDAEYAEDAETQFVFDY
ncbi:esterase [Amanita muscaria]